MKEGGCHLGKDIKILLVEGICCYLKVIVCGTIQSVQQIRFANIRVNSVFLHCCFDWQVDLIGLTFECNMHCNISVISGK